MCSKQRSVIFPKTCELTKVESEYIRLLSDRLVAVDGYLIVNGYFIPRCFGGFLSGDAWLCGKNYRQVCVR